MIIKNLILTYTKNLILKKNKLLIIFLFVLNVNTLFAQKKCSQFYLKTKQIISEQDKFLQIFEQDSLNILFYFSDLYYKNEYLYIWNEKQDLIIIYYKKSNHITKINNKKKLGKKITNFLSKKVIHLFPKKFISILNVNTICDTPQYNLKIKSKGLLKGNVSFSSCCYSSKIEKNLLGIEEAHLRKEDIFLSDKDIILCKEIIDFFRELSK